MPALTPTQQHQSLHLAVRYGGSFMAALAQAGLLADPANRAKLFDHFDQLLEYGPDGPFWKSTLPS